MSAKRNLISIVTISYNHEAFIAEAIDSFLMQKRNGFDLEIIIADDASTDSTQKIISDYAKKYPSLIRPILRKKNVGVRDNLLGALTEAKGKYIALCEGDDFWTNSLKLSKQYEYMESNNRAALCFHLVNITTPEGVNNNSVFPDQSVWSKFDIDQLLDHNFIQTNSVMYRNKFAYKDITTGDPLPLDWFLHIYHAKDGQIGFIPEILATYRRHENGVWWRTEATQKEFWRRNILKLMTAYDNILELFDADPLKKRIIELSRINQVIRILEKDSKYDGKSAVEQVNAVKPSLILSGGRVLADKIEKLEAEIKLQNDEIQEQLQVIAETQELVRQRDAKIVEILNSRMYKIGHATTAPMRISRKGAIKIKQSVFSMNTKSSDKEYTFSYSVDPKSRLAVIVHLYYVDLWQDISEKLKTISEPFDLYVSVTVDSDIDLGKVSEFHKETNIIKFPNRGRDVLPFLMIIKRILKSRNYKYILKIHTKKSKHRQDGGDWFADILDELLPSKLDKIFDTLSIASTGIIGPSKQVVSLSRYLGDNVKSLRWLISKTYGPKYAQNVMENSDRYPFIGGTMFWGRTDYFEKLCNLPIKPSDFQIEAGQVDGTLAHAIERALGMAMHGKDKTMYTVNARGDVHKLDKISYTETYERVG